VRRLVEDAQQLGVDLVALGQRLVEIHAADRGADVGEGQGDDRLLEVARLVGGAPGVEDRVEDQPVDGDRGVIARDHQLLRDLDDAFLNVEPAPDLVEERHDQVQPRFQRLGIAAEALDRPFITLRHDAHRGPQDDDGKSHEDERDDQEFGHCGLRRLRRRTVG
jgi:hypothetical protein